MSGAIHKSRRDRQHDRSLACAFGVGWLAALALAANTVVAAETPPEKAAERIGVPALAAGNQGLFPSTDFRAISGDCSDCATIPQARWYFSKDLVAVPRPGVGIAGMTRGIAAQEDVRRWYGSGGGKDAARPPLVWIGSPELVVDARLEPG